MKRVFDRLKRVNIQACATDEGIFTGGNGITEKVSGTVLASHMEGKDLER